MRNDLTGTQKPVILIIFDGWGVAPESNSNAVVSVHKPNINSYFASFPHTTLEAAGESVGLPHGEAGNSDVGHTNLGAGRIVYQDLPRINMAIADGSFLKNKIFDESIEHVKKNKSNMHIMGLVGSGGVHSSIEHLYALLWLMKEKGMNRVYLHLFTDGRDSPPSAALQTIEELDEKLKEVKIGQIATISGRYYAMDRDQRWDRVEKSYKTLVEGVGPVSPGVVETISGSYQRNISDEFIEPTIVTSGSNRPPSISANDSLIFFNFRPDRARQLTKAFVEDTFQGFNRPTKLKNLFFVSMTEYERNLSIKVAFPSPKIINPLSLVIATYKKRQLHIGETEKYAHVTYFFNGGIEDPFPLEDRVHIPSPKVATYDQKPQMAAYQITDYVVKQLRSNQYHFYVINYANADMVAHTGSLEATRTAVKVLDECLRKVVDEAYPLGGTVLMVADHGNAEQMISPVSGKPDTEHTLNPVPFLAISENLRGNNTQLQSGILADVAPTILKILKLPVPHEMLGRDLLA